MGRGSLHPRACLQVCSAVQNQDSSVIVDYTSGMQALLYMQAQKGLSNWKGQYYETTPPHQQGKSVEGEQQ